MNTLLESCATVTDAVETATRHVYRGRRIAETRVVADVLRDPPRARVYVVAFGQTAPGFDHWNEFSQLTPKQARKLAAELLEAADVAERATSARA